MSVWFGLHLPSYTHPDTAPAQSFDRVVDQVRSAEDAGFGLVTVMDHLYQISGVGEVDEPMLEAWSTLAALARETRHVRLGTLVTVTYRNPALLAKQATTLDTISGGRAILGIGAAWNDVEHAGYGFDFPPVRERMDRLEEALTIIKAMFSQERPTFHGQHYRIEAALNVPRPVQAGGPLILVGGGGEQRTLRIAARHADMTHWFPLGFDVLMRKTEILRRYCEEIGRDSGLDRTDHGVAGDRGRPGGRDRGCPRQPPSRASSVRHRRTTRAGRRSPSPLPRRRVYGFTFNNTIYRTPEQIGRVGELLQLVAPESSAAAR